jgi:hypothetical protein
LLDGLLDGLLDVLLEEGERSRLAGARTLGGAGAGGGGGEDGGCSALPAKSRLGARFLVAVASNDFVSGAVGDFGGEIGAWPAAVVDGCTRRRATNGDVSNGDDLRRSARTKVLFDGEVDGGSWLRARMLAGDAVDAGERGWSGGERGGNGESLRRAAPADGIFQERREGVRSRFQRSLPGVSPTIVCDDPCDERIISILPPLALRARWSVRRPRLQR